MFSLFSWGFVYELSDRLTAHVSCPIGCFIFIKMLMYSQFLTVSLLNAVRNNGQGRASNLMVKKHITTKFTESVPSHGPLLHVIPSLSLTPCFLSLSTL